MTKKRGKLKRRKKLRKAYFDLHNLDVEKIGVELVELHHIVEFNEFYRLGRFVDELGNVILLKKDFHVTGTVQDKNKKYELGVNDDQTKLILTDKSNNVLELTIGKDVHINKELIPYLLSYNQFLLRKIGW
ncbi:hypothetical protein JEQ21_05010 [Streptococcus sp. 121]|uniref:hypothetical protein n=1 Tax=Streptococcus sp. 121 TaxID=2797637 RepID=UPI0018F106F6|nr:hypothetical protein [Streptococcus sp. 121]MBJ6745831.1 hypothetical protein [Streptococcus sp. 121]